MFISFLFLFFYLTGDGLVFAAGQKWKRNRRLLTPAFHFDVLKGYIDVFNEEVEVLMVCHTKCYSMMKLQFCYSMPHTVLLNNEVEVLMVCYILNLIRLLK